VAETRAERDQREAEAYLDRAFQFLVDDFGYEYIGRIPVTTTSVVVRGYVNRHGGVQIEMSGDPPGVTFLGGLRKLKEGVAGPYDGDHFVRFDDIALVRRGTHDDLLSHNLNPDGWRGVVDTAVRLLKDNRLLVIGDDWIARDRVTAAWDRHFQTRFGFTPNRDHDESWPLSLFKSAFTFLLERGYRLVYDTSTLTPHEYLVTEELQYQSGASLVRIRCLDFRDGEWAVSRDGCDIVGRFRATPEEIKSVAGRLETELH